MKGRKIKSVLLVQPNLKWCDWSFKTFWEIIPINLCMLASVTDQEYEVEILDANMGGMDEDGFSKHVAEKAPDLVGITMLTTEYSRAAHKAAELVKKSLPDCVTVMGGVYATMNRTSAIKDGNMDYIVVGEGEEVFPDLLKHLNGEGPFPAAGVQRRGDGGAAAVEPAPFIRELDSLPFPAFHKIDYAKYINRDPRLSVDAPRRLPSARIRTSRGCPVNCSFCQVEHISGKRFRPRSVENVIKELKWQKETYGIKSMLFNDDNLVLNKKRAKALFRAMADEKLDLTWNATAVAVFALDDEMLELMKESGCRLIDIAIESGVERILKDIIGKPVNLDHARKMAAKARSLGIDLVANFIIGFPTETWDEIRRTIRFAEELEADYIKIFIATPLPHTRLYQMIVEQNLAVEGTDIEGELDWSTSKIASEHFTPNDLAILRAYEWDRINFTDPDRRAKIARMMRTTEEELDRLRKKTRDSVELKPRQ